MEHVPGFKINSPCPVNPNCQSKKVYESLIDKKLYSYDSGKKQFRLHKCNVRGGEKPTVTYLGSWRNNRTAKIRHVGPDRLVRTVLKHPKDAFTSDEDWEFIGLFESKLEWKQIDIPKDES